MLKTGTEPSLDLSRIYKTSLTVGESNISARLWIKCLHRQNSFLLGYISEEGTIYANSTVYLCIYVTKRSWDSAVGYRNWLRAGRHKDLVPVPVVPRIISSSQQSFRHWGPSSLLSCWCWGVLSPDYSGRSVNPTSAEVNKTLIYTSTPQYVFIA
jgi:hypothetical protein